LDSIRVCFASSYSLTGNIMEAAIFDGWRTTYITEIKNILS